MKFKWILKNFGFLAIVIALALPGCRSAATPVAFYTLSAAQETADENPGVSELRNKVISIGPARFPNFLDRPQIVSRSGANQLHISEFHRWAGDLDQDFLSILAENLSIRLASPRVLVYSWKDQVPPDYRIELEVHGFEGQMGEAVLLNVTWTVRSGEGGAEPLILRRSVIRKEISGSDYDALVAAHSQAVGELGGELATALLGLVKKQDAVQGR